MHRAALLRLARAGCSSYGSQPLTNVVGTRAYSSSTVSDPPSRRGYMAKAAQEPFLNGSSSIYVEEMYRAWLKDPNSVHKVCPQTS